MLRRLPQLVHISARELRARGGRSLLACLSLIIGIIAVIFVQATAGVAKAELIHLAELRQGRDGSAAITLTGDPVNNDVARRLIARPAAGADVALFASDVGAVVVGGAAPVPVVAYDGDVAAVRPFDLMRGNWPEPTATGSPVVLNRRAAEQLADIGTLSWKAAKGDIARRARVVAVVDDGEQDARAYVHRSMVAAQSGTVPTATLHLLARVPSGVAAESTAWLDWHVSAAGLPAHSKVTAVNVREGVDGQLQVVTAAFLGVGLIMLLVGVLGVLNIGLATLKERADELALRRSLGATKADVLILVLSESVLIGCAGALLAIAIALAAYHPLVAAAIGHGRSVPFPVDAAVYGIVVGGLAGAAGGIVPAMRAARLPIAAVMRA